MILKRSILMEDIQSEELCQITTAHVRVFEKYLTWKIRGQCKFKEATLDGTVTKGQ